MAIGMELSGVAVLVGAWSAGAVTDLAGGAVPPVLPVGKVGENRGSSYWKMTYHRTGEA